MATKVEVFRLKRQQVADAISRTLNHEVQPQMTDSEYIEFLEATIRKLQNSSSEAIARITQLQKELAKSRPHTPTPVEAEILKCFFQADTTELHESELLAMNPECEQACHTALDELCEFDLLKASKGDDKLYVITPRGQECCYTSRRSITQGKHSLATYASTDVDLP